MDVTGDSDVEGDETDKTAEKEKEKEKEKKKTKSKSPAASSRSSDDYVSCHHFYCI